MHTVLSSKALYKFGLKYLLTVYKVEVKGTEVTITKKSPSARLKMYVLGTFLMLLLRIKISTRVPLPRTPTTKMRAKRTGTM